MPFDKKTQKIIDRCLVTKKELRFINNLLNEQDILTYNDYMLISSKLDDISHQVNQASTTLSDNANLLLEKCIEIDYMAYARLAKITAVHNKTMRQKIYLLFHYMHECIAGMDNYAAHNFLVKLAPSIKNANIFWAVNNEQKMLEQKIEQEKMLLLRLEIVQKNLHFNKKNTNSNKSKLQEQLAFNEIYLAKLASTLLIPCLNMYRFVHARQNLKYKYHAESVHAAISPLKFRL